MVSDFGMTNYLDFPNYKELVEVYDWNLTINDEQYYKFTQRMDNRDGLSAHHVIQSFSPKDKLSPEEVNKLGWQLASRLSDKQHKFIVATHIDKKHPHNHILINAVNQMADRKLNWDNSTNRYLRLVSDMMAKEIGATVINPSKQSHTSYQLYKKTNHRFELKRRINFLLKHSESLADFYQNAETLSLIMDFSRKHDRFKMSDREMNWIRGKTLNKRRPYGQEFFTKYFVKRDIQNIITFCLERSKDYDNFLSMAEQLHLSVVPKTKQLAFTLTQGELSHTLTTAEVSRKIPYDKAFFENYFAKASIKDVPNQVLDNLQDDFQEWLNKEEIFYDEETIGKAYDDYVVEKNQEKEFEVYIEDRQIDTVLENGITVTVEFGIGRFGTVFIPDIQLDEVVKDDGSKGYLAYINEKDFYFLFDKTSADHNRYVRGSTLIRQFNGENQQLTFRRRPSVDTIKEKLAQIFLLIEVTPDQVAAKESLLEGLRQAQENMAEAKQKLNELAQMEEIVEGCRSEDREIKRLSHYQFATLNLSLAPNSKTIDEATLQLYEERLKRKRLSLIDRYRQASTDYDKQLKRSELFSEIYKEKVSPKIEVRPQAKDTSKG